MEITGIMRNRRIDLSEYVRATLLLGGILCAPVVTTTAQEQVPATAPQVQQVLPSYEGQNVVSVEIAGRPDLDQEKLPSLLTLRQGQPFSRAKSDQSIAALKSRAQLEDVQVEIRPQADGVRVLLVCQPAFYFGTFGFPGRRGQICLLPPATSFRLPATGTIFGCRSGDCSRPHSLGSFNRTATSKLK